ncbi:monofunctional biosynthetic peptidoglycan transglycosylase [Tellurirhabdus rosea]|uniref:monofunctional biosynthetic peptidoglycan transglycosylase n=1 Tax=Tellurirhabdus rosea TaxID=2674997 RepID=UPI00224FE1B9|nr:monofunctional biosynthetic peptidoglycan transglycosylase [Tellurirhabdus rosea]
MSPNRPRNTPRTPYPEKPASKRARSANRYDAAKGQNGLLRRYLQGRPVLQRIYWALVKLVVIVVLFSVGWVVLLKYVPVWFTPLIMTRKVEAIQEGKSSEIHKDWVPYEEISKEAVLAVVASEDQAFPNHWGFDFDEIQDAVRDNRTRKRPRGASTISQQVAKNVFLWNGRSYIRKGLEVYFTVLIELVWGKQRIMEVYLNVAETGNMTFGVEAASQRFYGHSAAKLSRAEAARIAAVLPNPRLFSIANPSAYIQRRSKQISRQMRLLGGRQYVKGL